MKKQITKILSFVIVVMLSILLFNFFLQFTSEKANIVEGANYTINQIDRILRANDMDLEQLTASLKEEYIIRAKMASYIVEGLDIEDTEDLREIVELMQIDEIHLFTLDGEIYAGSEPKYFGYTFDSGEQIMFFKPMLTDKDLVLCQDITPNTAEGKPMIYAAVWRSDGKGIVQIGLKPHRLLEAQEKNQLDHIFSTITTQDGILLLGIDRESGTIVGSTEMEFLDKQASEIGIDITEENINKSSFISFVNGSKRLCVMKPLNDILVVYAFEVSLLYDKIFSSMILVALYLSVVMLISIFVILYCIEHNILKNIQLLIDKLKQISNGNLDTRVEIDTSPEFIDLSNHLNLMVDSLLNTTAKLSQTIDAVDLKIGLYEYKSNMNRVLATSKLAGLLNLSEAEMNILLTNRSLFDAKISEIKQHPLYEQKNIYSLQTTPECYIKLETFTDETGGSGVVVDVTEDMLEMHQLQQERDHDSLTALFNRGAFYRKLDALFSSPESIKHGALVILDMDNLKTINDTYGHFGGNLALKQCAKILDGINTPNKICARLGGDEFAAFIYGVESHESVANLINWLEHTSADLSFTMLDEAISIHLSAGYVYCTDTSINYNELIKQADDALYVAKRTGKGRFCEV